MLQGNCTRTLSAPATSPADTLPQAARHLTLLDESAHRFTFQTFSDVKPNGRDPLAHCIIGTLDEHAARLVDLNQRGAGVYVTVQEADGQGRKLRNIKRCRCLYQEDDGGYRGCYPLPPHFVVATSPGRFHRYWLFHGGMTRIEFAGVMRRMVRDFGSDPAAQDGGRVLRLAGFDNHKRADPFQVRIVEEAGALPYSRAEILAAFPPIPPPARAAPANVRRLDEDDVVDALRNAGLWRSNNDGGCLCECPWTWEHSRGGGLAQYYLPGPGNAGIGGFVCGHAHCRHRGVGQLRLWLQLPDLREAKS